MNIKIAHFQVRWDNSEATEDLRLIKHVVLTSDLTSMKNWFPAGT